LCSYNLDGSVTVGPLYLTIFGVIGRAGQNERTCAPQHSVMDYRPCVPRLNHRRQIPMVESSLVST
jgi:hypothetical protein